MSHRRIVIGDIHGCPKTLNKLLNDKIKIHKSDYIYFLGDYIDRGPNSKKVIDIIIELLIMGFNVKCLIGNHELMLLESVHSNITFQTWLKNSGKVTLDSFKISHPSQLKRRYMLFFQSLQYYIELDDFILVHGGLNFEIEEPLKDVLSMCWTRNLTVDKSKIGGRRIIVGHTPTKLSKIKKTLEEDRILLDGGCVYNNLENDMGYLVALELNSMELFTQKNVE